MKAPDAGKKRQCTEVDYDFTDDYKELKEDADCDYDIDTDSTDNNFEGYREPHQCKKGKDKKSSCKKISQCGESGI